MTTIQFLSSLRRLGVKLWVDGDRLGYSAPKGTMTPTLRAEIASCKAEILAFLRQASVTARATLPPLVPRSADEDSDLPLSFAQARLWFLAQLDPESAAYHMPFAFRLTGSLNVAALEQSLFEMVRRHDILRTAFPAVEGQPVQVISAPGNFVLPVVSLSELPEMKQEIEVRRLATEAAQRPFDLSRGPLWRVTLLKLDEQEHMLLVTTHHIISDGWSIGVFVWELKALYEAFSTGKPSPLDELPIQYADFALWQRQWLKGKTLEDLLSYWKAQLHDAPAVLSLPTDRPRPAVQTDRGGVEYFQLSPQLTKQLKALSQQSRATLYMTLLAVFATLLSRHSGQQDIVIGSPIANRNRRETESLIGFFVNTLALRIDMSGNPTFEELLARVKKLTLDAFAHQDLPFERLVSELRPERNLSHHPLFLVMFDLQNAPMGKLELPGLTLTPLEIEPVTAKFDLTLLMEQTEQGLRGKLEYNTDLFDATTIRRMAGHLPTLLEGIVTNPQQRILELPLLTEAERHQLLVAWNDTQAEYPQDQCLHQWFEAQVERTPDAVAVVFEVEQVTYRELNHRANRLAHYLQSLGVGPEVLVGLCVERSIEMVVGLLGIFKAGGAYVPLAPAYPKERLGFMLEDSQVFVLLTQEKWVEKLPEHKAHVICLDTDWRVIFQESEANPVSGVKPEHWAYVIYTSGSTGKPKGTMIVHQGLVNYLSWCTKAYAVTEGCGAPVHSSIGFDATITSLFSPLLVGQRVVLLPEKKE